MIPRILLAYLVFMFYHWTVTAGFISFNFGRDQGGYYNLLIDGFLKGQLNLPLDPRPELLALPDPYDPTLNAPYRLHDASLYKGKYYIYFGPAPAITLFLPYFFIFHRHMSENFAVFVFSYGGFLWLMGLLIYLRNKYFQQIPEWKLLLGIAILAFASVIPYLLRRPGIWEVALASGFFYLSGSIYFFCRAFNSPIPRLWMLLLGSTFLGLAFASRASYVLASVIILLILKRAFSPKIVLCALFPFLLCLSLIAYYNYSRFNNPFELGTSYQLPADDIRQEKKFDIRRTSTGAYFYLFHPPTINLNFPFVHLDSVNPPRPKWLHLTKPLRIEKIGGMFSVIPFTLLIFLMPLTCLTFEFFVIVLPAVLFMIVSFLLEGVTMRYLADFAPYFILGACMVWFYIDCVLSSKLVLKRILNTITVTLALISIFFGIAYSIDGPYECLLIENPKEYARLERWVGPVSNFLRSSH